PLGTGSYRLLVALLAVVLSVCYFASPSLAQTTFGSVVGTVTDKSGAVLAGATATLTNVATNEVRKMTVSDSGTYSFVNLQPGTYKLDVDDPGFKHFTASGIEVQTGGTTRTNAAMQVGDVSHTV